MRKGRGREKEEGRELGNIGEGNEKGERGTPGIREQ